MALFILALIFLNKQERGATLGQSVSTREALKRNVCFASSSEGPGIRDQRVLCKWMTQANSWADGLMTEVLQGHRRTWVLGPCLPTSDLSPVGTRLRCSINPVPIHAVTQCMIRKLLQLNPCSRNVATTSSPLGNHWDYSDHAQNPTNVQERKWFPKTAVFQPRHQRVLGSKSLHLLDLQDFSSPEGVSPI